MNTPDLLTSALDFLAGFAVALLSGLGVGGGGLLVVWLVFVRSCDQLTAQSINLLFFLFSSGAALPVHLIKRKLPGRLIFTLIFCGAIGAAAGSFLVKVIDPSTVRRLFGGLLMISGILSLRK